MTTTSESCESPIIRVENLSKKYGEITALDNVRLEIEKGELFGLLGPNGAGKTTLISILATILPVESGRAFVCGSDVAADQDSVRRNIGIVFQDPSLDDDLTGEENLDFHGRLYGLSASLRASRVKEALSLTDLSDRRRDLVKTYSGGMRRRLEIARGLMHRPRVLFLDEPTLGLDPQTRRRIWQYIRDLKDSYGMTLILTTHYMDEADQLCARIAVIDRGAIVALDTPEALKAGLGGDVISLQADTPPDAFIEGLRALEGSETISYADGIVTLTVKNGESFAPRAFELAHAAQVKIRSISMRTPNLEDVFIRLTGREIRDEAVKEPIDRIRIYMRGRNK